MPAARRSKRVSDENRPSRSSKGKGKEQVIPEPQEKDPEPAPDALKEFKKRCPGKSCKTCDSAPGLTVSHCPWCQYDAASANDFEGHIQGHINKAKVPLWNKKKQKFVTGRRCLLKDCAYENGKPHVTEQARNLTAHVCKYINNRPYLCEYCGERFADQSVFGRHQKNAKECRTKKAAAEAAAEGAEGKDHMKAKANKKGRKSSKRGKKTEDDFPGIPESVRRATPANEEPIAGPSFSFFSRSHTFASSSSSSSRRYNTSVPTAGPSHAPIDPFTQFSQMVNSDAWSADPLAVEGSSFTGSMDAFFDPLSAPANDIWWPSVPPENADDCLYRPAVPSTAQVPEYLYDVESFDPAPYSPPRFDRRAFELEFNNAPPPYPSPTVDYPVFNSSTNAASMPYLPDAFPAGAPETWYPLWDFCGSGYLSNAPGNS